MKKDFKVIGFDADDTLWLNETFYREGERSFYQLLSEYGSANLLAKELLKTEIQNIHLYGYGAKSFILSMIETALHLSNNTLSQKVVEGIINLGKDLINKPIVLLEGVQEVLDKLYRSGHKMIVATKGDLLDQERKLTNSNLEKYFHHIEIMSDKKEINYKKLLSHLDIEPEDFLMIGNSMKSDIIPVVNMGGYGIYVPCKDQWEYEKVVNVDGLENYWEISQISELNELLMPGL